MAGSGRLVAGRYRLTRQLGAGGMGRVWLADDEVLCRSVAIKEVALPHGFAADERAVLREWTLREAQAAARVCHPNVIRVFDVLQGEDRPWIVMEYVSSRSLLDLIVEAGPLPVGRVAGVGLAVLSALDAARRAGVLHHDVKPSNVLIADDGRVVLTDFGSAVTDGGAGALTATGRVLGSPNYIAPERLAQGVSTARADLWSLGATLYHAVEGRAPYARESTAATLWALAHLPPDPARRAGPITPVLDGLLQRDPAARMAPAEIAWRLRRLTHVQAVDDPHPADRPPSVVGRAAVPAAQPQRPVPTGPSLRPRRRVRRRVSVLAAVLAVMAVLTVPVVAGDGLPGPSVTSAERPRPVPTPSSSSSPGMFVIPHDFAWWDDRSGFRVAVPRAWLNNREDTGAVLFSAPGGQPTLRIGAWATGAPDPITALVDQERTARLAAYRRIRIEALPRSPEAVWEYTFRDPQAGPVHGLERVVARDSSTYLIEWHAPTAAWAANLQDLAVVMESFGPLRGA
jgi:serine/threonine protein kinase